MRAKIVDGRAQTLTVRRVLICLVVGRRGQETRHPSMVAGAAPHVHANALTVIRVTLIRATHRVTVEHAAVVDSDIPIRGSRHVHAGRGRNIIHLRHAGALTHSIHNRHYTIGEGKQPGQ